MARIAGVDLPKNKRMDIALTYLYGIGRKNAKDVLEKAAVPLDTNSDALTEDQVAKIREVLETTYRVEGDLRRDVAMNIKRLMDMSCYRGLRHRKGLPVRGQRTHTNSRTRKGPKKAVARSKKS